MKVKNFFFAAPWGTIEAKYQEAAETSTSGISAIELHWQRRNPMGKTRHPPAAIQALQIFLDAYFAHAPIALDWNMLLLRDVPKFFQRTLKICANISHGRVATYKGLAHLTGNPLAARAVGQAMARNPYPLVVPCHRVIQSGGHLGSYAHGVEKKKMLLECEGVVVDDSYQVRDDFIIFSAA